MPMETVPENRMRETERKPHASEALRARCPHCRKLYMIQFADVKEAKPRFECVQCHNRFWLSMADMDFTQEVVGIPVQFKEMPRPLSAPKPPPAGASAADLKPCPKCFKPVSSLVGECPHCGVLMARVKEFTIEETWPPHSPELAASWRKVVQDYGNEKLHETFLLQAQREDHLAYAGGQYRQMRELMPTDETTLQRLRVLDALARGLIPEVAERPHRGYTRVWQVPLAAATLLMVVGFFIPMFRNMVGVGAAILFIAIAMRLQVRRRA